MARRGHALLGLALAGAACSEPAGPAPAAVASPPPPVVIEHRPTALVRIAAGTYRPMFPGKDQPEIAPVAEFWLEEHAVTNAQFVAFVGAVPAWRRSRVQRLFADTTYLAHWRGDLEPGNGIGDRPVTHVSWFAARAYARWIDRRLPTLAEWEYVAAAGDRGPDGAADPGFQRRILDWYAKPSPVVPAPVNSTFRNALGVADLHGLVWEWVEDFNTALVTGESRGDAALERSLFCGAGSLGTADPADYAAFMRFAFRSSLRASYTVKNLGFRCAADRPAEPTPACCAEQRGSTPLPDTSLYGLESTWRDQHGAEHRLADFRGKLRIVAMVFTHCQYACPRTLADLRRLDAAIPPARRADVHFLLPSFDHERDHPDALAAFAEREHLDPARWTLLHGDAAAVRELAAALGISYRRTETGDFAHSNAITILDRDGTVLHQEVGIGVDPTALVAHLR